jgi:hypothetical protein
MIARSRSAQPIWRFDSSADIAQTGESVTMEIQSASESRRARSMRRTRKMLADRMIGSGWRDRCPSSSSDATDPARTRTAQPDARLVAASGLLRDPRDLGGELDLIIHPVTAQ